MRTQHTQATTTIARDVVFLFPFDEIDKRNISKFSGQNMKMWFGFDITTGTIVGNASSIHDESGTSEISGPFAQDTSASLKLNFDEKSEFGVTQEFPDTQQQLPPFPFYNEEDILNLDAVIVTPPPQLSRTIRVKLIYEEPSEPIPVEDSWE